MDNPSPDQRTSHPSHDRSLPISSSSSSSSSSSLPLSGTLIGQHILEYVRQDYLLPPLVLPSTTTTRRNHGSTIQSYPYTWPPLSSSTVEYRYRTECRNFLSYYSAVPVSSSTSSSSTSAAASAVLQSSGPVQSHEEDNDQDLTINQQLRTTLQEIYQLVRTIQHDTISYALIGQPYDDTCHPNDITAVRPCLLYILGYGLGLSSIHHHRSNNSNHNNSTIIHIAKDLLRKHIHQYSVTISDNNTTIIKNNIDDRNHLHNTPKEYLDYQRSVGFPFVYLSDILLDQLFHHCLHDGYQITNTNSNATINSSSSVGTTSSSSSIRNHATMLDEPYFIPSVPEWLDYYKQILCFITENLPSSFDKVSNPHSYSVSIWYDGLVTIMVTLWEALGTYLQFHPEVFSTVITNHVLDHVLWILVHTLGSTVHHQYLYRHPLYIRSWQTFLKRLVTLPNYTFSYLRYRCNGIDSILYQRNIDSITDTSSSSFGNPYLLSIHTQNSDPLVWLCITQYLEDITTVHLRQYPNPQNKQNVYLKSMQKDYKDTVQRFLSLLVSIAVSKESSSSIDISLLPSLLAYNLQWLGMEKSLTSTHKIDRKEVLNSLSQGLRLLPYIYGKLPLEITQSCLLILSEFVSKQTSKPDENEILQELVSIVKNILDTSFTLFGIEIITDDQNNGYPTLKLTTLLSSFHCDLSLRLPPIPSSLLSSLTNLLPKDPSTIKPIYSLDRFSTLSVNPYEYASVLVDIHDKSMRNKGTIITTVTKTNESSIITKNIQYLVSLFFLWLSTYPQYSRTLIRTEYIENEYTRVMDTTIASLILQLCLYRSYLQYYTRNEQRLDNDTMERSLVSCSQKYHEIQRHLYIFLHAPRIKDTLYELNMINETMDSFDQYIHDNRTVDDADTIRNNLLTNEEENDEDDDDKTNKASSRLSSSTVKQYIHSYEQERKNGTIIGGLGSRRVITDEEKSGDIVTLGKSTTSSLSTSPFQTGGLGSLFNRSSNNTNNSNTSSSLTTTLTTTTTGVTPKSTGAHSTSSSGNKSIQQRLETLNKKYMVTDSAYVSLVSRTVDPFFTVLNHQEQTSLHRTLLSNNLAVTSSWGPSLSLSFLFRTLVTLSRASQLTYQTELDIMDHILDHLLGDTASRYDTVHDILDSIVNISKIRHHYLHSIVRYLVYTYPFFIEWSIQRLFSLIDIYEYVQKLRDAVDTYYEHKREAEDEDETLVPGPSKNSSSEEYFWIAYKDTPFIVQRYYRTQRLQRDSNTVRALVKDHPLGLYLLTNLDLIYPSTATFIANPSVSSSSSSSSTVGILGNLFTSHILFHACLVSFLHLETDTIHSVPLSSYLALFANGANTALKMIQRTVGKGKQRNDTEVNHNFEPGDEDEEDDTSEERSSMRSTTEIQPTLMSIIHVLNDIILGTSFTSVAYPLNELLSLFTVKKIPKIYLPFSLSSSSSSPSLSTVSLPFWTTVQNDPLFLPRIHYNPALIRILSYFQVASLYTVYPVNTLPYYRTDDDTSLNDSLPSPVSLPSLFVLPLEFLTDSMYHQLLLLHSLNNLSTNALWYDSIVIMATLSTYYSTVFSQYTLPWNIYTEEYRTVTQSPSTSLIVPLRMTTNRSSINISNATKHRKVLNTDSDTDTDANDQNDSDDDDDPEWNSRSTGKRRSVSIPRQRSKNRSNDEELRTTKYDNNDDDDTNSTDDLQYFTEYESNDDNDDEDTTEVYQSPRKTSASASRKNHWSVSSKRSTGVSTGVSSPHYVTQIIPSLTPEKDNNLSWRSNVSPLVSSSSATVVSSLSKEKKRTLNPTVILSALDMSKLDPPKESFYHRSYRGESNRNDSDEEQESDTSSVSSSSVSSSTTLPLTHGMRTCTPQSLFSLAIILCNSVTMLLEPAALSIHSIDDTIPVDTDTTPSSSSSSASLSALQHTLEQIGLVLGINPSIQSTNGSDFSILRYVFALQRMLIHLCYSIMLTPLELSFPTDTATASSISSSSSSSTGVNTMNAQQRQSLARIKTSLIEIFGKYIRDTLFPVLEKVIHIIYLRIDTRLAKQDTRGSPTVTVEPSSLASSVVLPPYLLDRPRISKDEGVQILSSIYHFGTDIVSLTKGLTMYIQRLRNVKTKDSILSIPIAVLNVYRILPSFVQELHEFIDIYSDAHEILLARYRPREKLTPEEKEEINDRIARLDTPYVPLPEPMITEPFSSTTKRKKPSSSSAAAAAVAVLPNLSILRPPYRVFLLWRRCLLLSSVLLTDLPKMYERLSLHYDEIIDRTNRRDASSTNARNLLHRGPVIDDDEDEGTTTGNKVTYTSQRNSSIVVDESMEEWTNMEPRDGMKKIRYEQDNDDDNDYTLEELMRLRTMNNKPVNHQEEKLEKEKDKERTNDTKVSMDITTNSDSLITIPPSSTVLPVSSTPDVSNDRGRHGNPPSIPVVFSSSSSSSSTVVPLPSSSKISASLTATVPVPSSLPLAMNPLNMLNLLNITAIHQQQQQQLLQAHVLQAGYRHLLMTAAASVTAAAANSSSSSLHPFPVTNSSSSRRRKSTSSSRSSSSSSSSRTSSATDTSTESSSSSSSSSSSNHHRHRSSHHKKKKKKNYHRSRERKEKRSKSSKHHHHGHGSRSRSKTNNHHRKIEKRSTTDVTVRTSEEKKKKDVDDDNIHNYYENNEDKDDNGTDYALNRNDYTSNSEVEDGWGGSSEYERE